MSKTEATLSDDVQKEEMILRTTSLRPFLIEGSADDRPDGYVVLHVPEWMLDFPVLRCGDHVLLVLGPTVLELDTTIAAGIYAVAWADLSPSKQLRVKKIRGSVLRLLDVNDLSEIGEIRIVCPDCAETMQKSEYEIEDGGALAYHWTCGCEHPPLEPA